MLSLLSAPMFTGSELVSPTYPTYPLSDDAGGVTVPAPRTVVLDGYQYAIETKEYKHTSRPTMRNASAVNGAADDSLFDLDGAWARYRHSWHLGAGQELDDLGDEDSSPYRYLKSFNFKPWVNGQLKTTVTWEKLTNALSGSMTTGVLEVCHQWALVSNGPTTKTAPSAGQTGTIASADAEWLSVTGLTGNVTAASNDGVQFFIGTTNALYALQSGATAASSLSAGNVDTVAFVANRLLVGNGNILYEVGSTGTRTAIVTHFQASFRWTIIFAIGSKIYVGGYAGDRSELYTLATDSAGALVRSTEAAPFQRGEAIVSAESYAGFVLLGTSYGIRFATVGADGTLTYGPLINPYDFSVQGPIVCADGYAYVAGEVSGDSGTYSTAILMLDLSRFTEPLRPAYAIVHATGDTDEWYHELAISTNGDLIGFDQNSEQVAVVQSNSNAYPAAYIQSGLIRFGTIEPKVLMQIDVGFDELPTGCTLKAAVYDEDWTVIAFATAVAGHTELTVGLGNTEVRGCYVELYVEMADSTTEVVVRWWRLRGYPVVPAVQQWLLPIIATEYVTMGAGSGARIRQDPQAMVDRLQALWETKKATTLVIGTKSYAVRVEDFEANVYKWETDGKHFQDLIILRLVAV
ncbi:MAG: hypothetical protein KA274_19750 [Ilumatobacteraceae bacterium]|nr:hypothetical protein [Ilumatobacteraceae bacterium]